MFNFSGPLSFLFHPSTFPYLYSGGSRPELKGGRNLSDGDKVIQFYNFRVMGDSPATISCIYEGRDYDKSDA